LELGLQPRLTCQEIFAKICDPQSIHGSSKQLMLLSKWGWHLIRLLQTLLRLIPETWRMHALSLARA
jgi:hypothetical protein